MMALHIVLYNSRYYYTSIKHYPIRAQHLLLICFILPGCINRRTCGLLTNTSDDKYLKSIDHSFEWVWYYSVGNITLNLYRTIFNEHTEIHLVNENIMTAFPLPRHMGGGSNPHLNASQQYHHTVVNVYFYM